ncbi:BtrH N-terminal domain-containing protein [Myroides marinus]|uniref:BtrH N-terminal domain-containing protein n=1 Tax=Myroides marinus TaxID=703342 RepID=UPI002574DC20|nr:BtrH N-terminal domain-containing protein [Myroides marinus]MDM1348254.1 BtrH N-terminal domain-containing protein [Myroides marinus]MDM1351767.1 BtrH N-terminal domain-containing protein [Myroides marinus]MDM1355356.1 BtrH N-terminal domain-containing protein [Myroides marinus]MDM1358974.1 BtrH N-terminal domain-containing protein [Myroides marinus]MDM1366028.1 BtrH N-terminal domain-containing protein [Myroides marinus]
MIVDFKHHQSAHCENGVASNLLINQGLPISEPMAFGLGSGLFYVYLPFVKVNHAPAISYRPLPGLIFNRLAKRLGLKVKRIKFSNRAKAQQVLEQKIAEGIPCGLQVGVYHLPYFPEEYRFHFNAHNLVVYGKEGDNFLVSDPVMEITTALTPAELERVRFAQGAFAPKGQIYYPIELPQSIDWEVAIRKAIKKTCTDMLAPVPIVGVKGMRMVARAIVKWPKKVGVPKANHYLAQMVRMQEEIGTGGGGFRFIYAAFLQEAGNKIGNTRLIDLSKEMTAIGDSWRDFAVNAARVYKKRKNGEDVYIALSKELMSLADREEQFFKKLKRAI